MKDSGLPQIPENPRSPNLVDLAAGLLQEIAKLAAYHHGDPAVSLAADGVGGVLKAARDFWRARQDATGAQFLGHVRKMLLRQEVLLKKLERKESAEPLADVFTTVFHAAINDDEAAKAKFYAAFMVGNLSHGLTLSKQVMLLDAMKRLRAHELYVLLMFSKALAAQAGLAVVQDFTGRANFNFGLSPTQESPAEKFLSFELSGQAVSALAGCGLMVPQSSSAFVGIGAGNIAYHLGPMGSLLSKMILDNLEDIGPVVPEGHPPEEPPLMGDAV